MSVIGVWILTTHTLGAALALLHHAIFAFDTSDTSPTGEVLGSAAFWIPAVIEFPLSLAVGLSLTFGASPLGDWLFRLTMTAEKRPSESEES